MYYLDKIGQAIEFIEDNLSENITIEDVARVGCLSTYHFHRIFQMMVGDSVMGYIRKRRLSAAMKKLTETDERIIQIAVEYQFESQEAFSRSFKKCFGITPGLCRKNKVKLKEYDRISFTNEEFSNYAGGIFMEPKIVNKESFMVIGPGVRSTPENGQNFIQIPKFVQKCIAEKYWEKIPNQIHPETTYGICTDMDPSGSFTYMTAKEVSTLKTIPKGMIGKIIPAAKYAVFTAKGKVPDKIQEVTRTIYGEWLNKSGKERSETEDLEVYEESRMNLPEPEVDIYVPIK